MKKIVLLFTVLCAGALNSMDHVKNGHTPLENLSLEAKNALTLAFETKNLDTVITTLKKISDTDDELYNKAMFNILYVAKDKHAFKNLVHILARQFNMHPHKIAEKFKTPTSKKYVELYNELEKNVIDKQNIITIKKLIEGGVDVTANPNILFLAIFAENPKAAIIKLLLDHGANPYVTGSDGLTPLEFLNAARKNIPEYKQIKLLLEHATNKGNL